MGNKEISGAASAAGGPDMDCKEMLKKARLELRSRKKKKQEVVEKIRALQNIQNQDVRATSSGSLTVIDRLQKVDGDLGVEIRILENLISDAEKIIISDKGMNNSKKISELLELFKKITEKEE